MNGEFNRYDAFNLLKGHIENTVRAYMSLYPVPYDLNIESLDHGHELKCTLLFPKEEFLPVVNECRCCHNDRCDICAPPDGIPGHKKNTI
jgi:hypothetical protein